MGGMYNRQDADDLCSVSCLERLEAPAYFQQRQSCVVNTVVLLFRKIRFRCSVREIEAFGYRHPRMLIRNSY